MVNRMRHTRSQRGNTRSHHALKGLALTKCPDCNSAVIRHQACSNCGKYKGRVVINLEAKSVKAKGKSVKKVETK
ncbi:MAG: 50S ribosomal protein L32 [Candidatus Paceibacterota bacterium]|nr:50S ribosomal protein L32 [Candidatus Paceibacterota bacterium]